MKILMASTVFCLGLLFCNVSFASSVDRQYDTAVMHKMIYGLNKDESDMLVQINNHAIEEKISLSDRLNEVSSIYRYLCSTGETDKCSMVEKLDNISNRMDTVVKKYF